MAPTHFVVRKKSFLADFGPYKKAGIPQKTLDQKFVKIHKIIKNHGGHKTALSLVEQ